MLSVDSSIYGQSTQWNDVDSRQEHVFVSMATDGLNELFPIHDENKVKRSYTYCDECDELNVGNTQYLAIQCEFNTPYGID